MHYNILVVDDDEPVHIFLNILLRGDYHLFKAWDAEQAFEILDREKVDLIITDIHMPGMSGLEFLQKLKSGADEKNIPFLVMTSKPTVEKEKEALNLGAEDFISKNFFNQKDEFLAHIRKKLEEAVKKE